MNFKILLIIFIATLLYACGVKGPPTPPPDTSIPSYQDKFLDKDPTTATTATTAK